MPGRNPQEAVDAFLQPLKDALGVLADHGQIRVVKKGGYLKHHEHTWFLNDPGDGMWLRGLGQFHAEMRFEIIDADPAKHEGGRLRVKTNGYLYRLESSTDGPRTDLWRIHWHPTGDSPYKEPHIHVPNDLDRHLPTGRITFEKVIAWCVEEGAALTCDQDEALNWLVECEAPHLLYRSWS